MGNGWPAGRVNRRRLLGGTVAVGLGAAFAAACRGGGGGGDSATQGVTTTRPTVADPVSVQRGGELIVRRQSNLAFWDPQRSPGGFDPPINDLYSARLLRVDNKGDLGPELAERWEQVDPQTVALRLRGDIQFGDGTPFNAEAVKYSIERGQSRELGAPVRATHALIERVEMPDPRSVVLKVTEPNAAFMEQLALQPGRIISPTAHQRLGDDRFNRAPVAAGPYIVQQIVPDGESTFTKNPNWPLKDSAGGALPYFDRVRVKVIPEDASGIAALRAGEIDIDYVVELPNVAQLRGQRGLEVLLLDDARFSVVEFNTVTPPTNNIDLRKAINYAFDREEINKIIAAGMGKPAKGPLTALSWAYDPNTPHYTFNPAKVREHLAAAGYPNGLDMRGASFFQEHGEMLQTQLSRQNIRIQVDNLELAVFQDRFRRRGEYPVATSSGPVPEGDPYNFFLGRYGSRGLFNAGQPNYPEWDETIARSVREFNREERKKIYARLQAMDYEWAYRGWTITMPRAMGLTNKLKNITWMGYNPDFRFAWKQQ
jgi:peptide/nickel transport system substrate-binding protein